MQVTGQAVCKEGEGSELCFGCKHNRTGKKMQTSHFMAQERVGGMQKATEITLLHGEVTRWQEGGRGRDRVRQHWGVAEKNLRGKWATANRVRVKIKLVGRLPRKYGSRTSIYRKKGFIITWCLQKNLKGCTANTSLNILIPSVFFPIFPYFRITFAKLSP